MKYIIFSSLLFLLSCVSEENKSTVAAPPQDSVVAPIAAIQPSTMPKEGPKVLLDGVSAGTELTNKQTNGIIFSR